MSEPRSYWVGLPVEVTVHDNGNVIYKIDTSEAGRGIRELPLPEPPGDADTETWYRAVEAEMEADADTVDRHTDEPDSAEEMPTVEVTVTRSAGTDGAVVVFIDTDFEPTGDIPLRVLVNDFDVYAPVPFAPRDEGDRESTTHKLTATPIYDEEN